MQPHSTVQPPARSRSADSETTSAAAGFCALELLAPALLFLGLVVFSWHYSGYGLVPTDEGFALSTPLRYVLGDVPFRESGLTIGRSAAQLWRFVYALHTEITVFEVRLLSCAAHLFCLWLYYLLFVRFTRPAFATLLLIPLAFINIGVFRSGSYEWFGANGMHAGLAAWLLAGLASRPSRSIIYALLSVSAFVSGAVAYWGFSVVPALIPGLLLVLLLPRLRAVREHCGPCWNRCGWSIFIAFSALVGLLVLLLLVTGLWRDILRDLDILSLYKDYAQDNAPGSLRRLRLYAYYLKLYAPGWGLCLGLGLLSLLAARLAGQCPMIWAGLLFVPYLAGCILFLRWMPEMNMFARIWTFLAAWGLGLLAAALTVVSRPASKTLSLVFWAVSLACLGMSLIQTFLAGTRVWNAGFAVAPVVGVSMLVLIDWARNRRPSVSAGVPMVYLGAFAVLLGSSSLYRIYHYQMGEKPTSELTVAFSHPKLRGLRSHAERVSRVETLVEMVSRHSRPGDFVLEYAGMPVLFFLTATRPALLWGWSEPMHGKEIALRQKQWLLEQKRPVSCCVLNTWSEAQFGSDAIIEYVRENFVLVEKSVPFEVYVPAESLVEDGGGR